ncbi:hypothetical protein [Halomarina oriensis]|uniref:hypothetical protein n=1 Tax=Halomarina oriensis TaxID=671145 RepID=UPI0018EEFCB5|nr:hypothetical protein [Halomarina oriensis]
MECDRRTFVRASAAGVAAVGTAGTGVAAAQENGSGNQSGGESGGTGNQSGGGNASGGGGGGGGAGEGPTVDTQGLLVIFGAAVMAALSPVVFGLLLLARGRGGSQDGDETTRSGGRRYDGS